MKNYYFCWWQMSRRRKKRNYIFWKYTQKAFYSCIFYLQFTKTPWEMPVMNIIYWLMYTMKITIIIIKQKTTIVCWLKMSWISKNRNDIFWNYTQKDFYSCFSKISTTRKYWEMQVINIIFLVMYTTEIDIIITNKKQLLFIVFIFHEEVKRGMISFETTHKRLSIHVFFICNSQK